MTLDGGKKILVFRNGCLFSLSEEQVLKQDLGAVIDWLRFNSYANGVSQRAPQIGS